MTPGIEFVLDASALLALLFGEPCAEFVQSVLYRSAVSAVNLNEVLVKLIEKGLAPIPAGEMIQALGLTILPFDE